MEGSSQVRGWNEEECKAMHMYYNAEVHAFQPYNHSFQQYVGIPQIFQPSVGNPNPPPPISEMVLTRSKRKVVQDEEDDDVQIATPSVPKRKTTTKKVTKNIMMKEKEGETEKEKKHWKYADVEVMIALHEEMESEFLKNAKKKYVEFLCCAIFFQKKSKKTSNFRLGHLKALAFPPSPPFPP
jgi:hypothetical protein